MINDSDPGTISVMPSRTARFLWLLPCLALSCQAPDLSAAIEEYGYLIDDSNAQLCECHQDAGYSSRSECSDSLGFVGPFERECIADAFEGHEKDGEAYLACTSAAYDDYLSCLTNNALACPDGGVAVCRDANTVALEQCNQVPATVRAAIMACTAP